MKNSCRKQSKSPRAESVFQESQCVVGNLMWCALMVLQANLQSLNSRIGLCDSVRYDWGFKTPNVRLLWCNCEYFAFLCVLQNLHKQLEEAIQDGEIWVMQLKDTEYELEGSRERVQQQATEILHKASKIFLCLLLFRTIVYSVKGKFSSLSAYVTVIFLVLSPPHCRDTGNSESSPL